MNEREIADWEREIRHSKVMQEQRKSKREGWELKNQSQPCVNNVKTSSAWTTYSTSHSEQLNED